MLTKIEAENIKGHSFSYELGPLTAITGPNFSGKTAIIEAIRLALIGHIPEIGKRTSATMELASGPRMMVCAHISSAQEPILRIFGSGGIVSGERAELNDLPLLNSEHYFSLTDKERTQYVFERIGKLEGASTVIAAQAQGLIFAGATKEHEASHEKWVGKLRALLKERGIQVGLAELVHELKEHYTYANGRVRGTQGATTILTELKNREAAATTSSDYCQKEIKKLGATIDDLGSTIRTLQKAQSDRDQAATQLDKLRGWQKGGEDWPKLIAATEAELAAIQLVVPPVVLDPAHLRTRHAVLDTEIKQLKGLGELNGEELTALDALEECPYCKSKSRGWKQHLKAKLKKDSEETAEQLAKKGCEFETLNNQLKAATKDLAEAVEASKTYEKALRRRDELKTQITNYKATQEVAQKQRAAYQEEITRLEAVLAQPPAGGTDELRVELEAAREALQHWQDKLRVAIALEQDIKRAAEAQLEHQTAVAQLDVIKTFGKFVEEKRKAIIEGVFFKLVADANALCEGILRSPIAFHDGTVGRWTQDRFIPHRVFSGVEKALCYVAIAMALSTQATERIVLLDELGRMTQSVRRNVMLRLKEAANKGLIDQAIVVIPTDVGSEECLSPYWKRIEL